MLEPVKEAYFGKPDTILTFDEIEVETVNLKLTIHRFPILQYPPAERDTPDASVRPLVE